jgi:hypothetical protein
MALNHPRFSSNGTGERPEPALDSLDDLNRRTAEALASRYDWLNRLWADAEARLKAMQVPRYVWIVYKEQNVDPDEVYSECRCECLGLVRVRGEWRLCIGQWYRNEYDLQPSDPDQPTDWKPVLDCSVEERVEAAPHIGKLREAVVESAEQFIVRVDDAVAHLTKALEQF